LDPVKRDTLVTDAGGLEAVSGVKVRKATRGNTESSI